MDEKTTQKQESTPDILSVVELIFNLTKEDIVQSAKSIISKFGIIHPISFNIIIVQIIHRSITIRMNEIDLYLSFLRKIKSFESNIFDMYVRFLLKDDTHESFYILDKMIQQNLIQSEIIKNKNQQYFVHYMTEEEFHQLKGYSYRQEVQEILENYEELSKNDWELHKKLIEEGANPNEIAKIIRNDELGKLQEISSQANFNIDQKIEPSLYERCSFINQNKVSLINFAAFFGSVKCFKYLLMNGAKMKITGKYAIAGGNLEIIHLCEQNHVSFYKAYETAIEFYKNDIFIYLYENKIEKIDNLESLGNLCIKFWNIEIFKFLLKNGMKINEDFIYDAASDGNLYLVEHFLKECPIPKYILIFSAESGNIELVEYALKQKGIGINDKNKDGKTALMKASLKGYTEIVKLLLEQEGIDINAKDSGGSTALIMASTCNHIEIVKLLLEQEGIDINAKDDYGNTALIHASYNGYTEIVKLLLEQEGINVNAQSKSGWTSLIAASLNGHIGTVKLLLEQKGIDINAKDDPGKTALMYASKNGYTEIVKLLLEQEGINVNAKDNDGKTALILASENGYTEIVKLLEN